jgi:Ni,Fe-hydrogenase III large subunit
MRWAKRLADRNAWMGAIEDLAQGRRSLLGLWGEPGCSRMATHGGQTIEVLELACPDNAFPSVGARHAPAIRLERTLCDLVGLRAEGATDTRPWLDHGRWAIRQPLGAAQPSRGPEPYPFLAAEGESLHQIPVGPVHAGIIEPGHFRFTAAGETVVRLEERLGYVHRGLVGQMARADFTHAAKLAGRVSGDSTVAYALAFAQAVENANGLMPPPRAEWLRALMAELERLANHLGDIGAICNDAAFALMQAHCAVLREEILRASQAAFGHRMMMDCILPGGVATDLTGEGVQAIRSVKNVIAERLPWLIGLYDDTASLQDRTVGTGAVSLEQVRLFAAGGYVGRGAGRPFDARSAFPYAPYDELEFSVPVREEGDVNARVWIRVEEVGQSLALIEQILARLPSGPIATPLPGSPGEGVALVEGFRGDIFVWVRISDQKVEHAYLRDPSWFQWPLLEAAIEGNIVADFPLCNKSFNCAYAGVDL